MGKYHPLPSHPFLFSPSLVLFQEHWFLASSQTFQSCICLRDFVMTVPSDWKILPLDSHTSHVSLPSGLCSNISFSVRPTWLPHFNCNSTTRIPDMFSLVLFLTISISYFHTLLFHLSHLSVFWLFPVECKFHQGKDLFFFNSLRHPQAHSSYLQTLVNSVNVGYSFLLSFFKKCVSWYVVFSLLFSSRNFLPVFFGHAACGILIPQPGIKPEPLAMEEQSLNHWTTRKILVPFFLKLCLFLILWPVFPDHSLLCFPFIQFPFQSPASNHPSHVDVLPGFSHGQFYSHPSLPYPPHSIAL